MIRVLLLIVTILCSSNLCTAASFDTANSYFATGKYQQAQNAYEQIIRDEGYSASLCYNLANTYAQLGQTGMAILYYERALRLNPSNGDVHHNLMRIQEEAHLLGEGGAMKKILSAHNLNLWSFLALFFLAALVVLLSLYKHPLLKGPYRLTSALTTLSLCLVISTSLCFFTYQQWPASIVIHETNLLLSPFEGAQNQGKMIEGQTVFNQQIHGDFVLIKDNNGRSGWVKDTDIKEI